MLPQTAAFILETFRWRPVTAGGMCHSLHQASEVDDIDIFWFLGFAHKATKDIIWVGFLLDLFFVGA